MYPGALPFIWIRSCLWGVYRDYISGFSLCPLVDGHLQIHLAWMHTAMHTATSPEAEHWCMAQAVTMNIATSITRLNLTLCINAAARLVTDLVKCIVWIESLVQRLLEGFCGWFSFQGKQIHLLTHTASKGNAGQAYRVLRHLKSAFFKLGNF